MDITSKSLSRGVGGSYTKWQREPPAHKIYQVETPEGRTVITVYAENRTLGDNDHPTIQLIEDATEFKSEITWNELPDDTRDAIRNHLSEKVKTDNFFKD